MDIYEPQRCHWIGLVVPKRFAKRAVTRNLFKRQMREQLCRHRDELPAGQWLIRLKAPFERRVYPSGASQALRRTARDELCQVVERALAA